MCTRENASMVVGGRKVSQEVLLVEKANHGAIDSIMSGKQPNRVLAKSTIVHYTVEIS